MKAPIIEDPNMRRPKDDNEKCMLWMRQAGDGIAITTIDKFGGTEDPLRLTRADAYFQLGGRNGSGMLFVESPLPSWHVKTQKTKGGEKSYAR